MLIIILSSVALAAEDPIVDNSEWNNYLDVVDNVFTVIFAIEMILKVSVENFWCNNDKYLKNKIIKIPKCKTSSYDVENGTKSLHRFEVFSI